MRDALGGEVPREYFDALAESPEEAGAQYTLYQDRAEFARRAGMKDEG